MLLTPAAQSGHEVEPEALAAVDHADAVVLDADGDAPPSDDPGADVAQPGRELPDDLPGLRIIAARKRPSVQQEQQVEVVEVAQRRAPGDGADGDLLADEEPAAAVMEVGDEVADERLRDEAPE